jgi:hypothetical protein
MGFSQELYHGSITFTLYMFFISNKKTFKSIALQFLDLVRYFSYTPYQKIFLKIIQFDPHSY